jgi:hypothetical protein
LTFFGPPITVRKHVFAPVPMTAMVQRDHHLQKGDPQVPLIAKAGCDTYVDDVITELWGPN